MSYSEDYRLSYQQKIFLNYDLNMSNHGSGQDSFRFHIDQDSFETYENSYSAYQF